MRRNLHDPVFLEHDIIGQHAIDTAAERAFMHVWRRLSAGPALKEIAGDTIAGSDARHARPDLDDLAGAVRERHEILAHRHAIAAARDGIIAKIERAGFDLDQNLAIGRLRLRPFDLLQRVDAGAAFGQLIGTHGLLALIVSPGPAPLTTAFAGIVARPQEPGYEPIARLLARAMRILLAGPAKIPLGIAQILPARLRLDISLLLPELPPLDRHLPPDRVRRIESLQHAAVARRFLRRDLIGHRGEAAIGARTNRKGAGALCQRAEAGARPVEHFDPPDMAIAVRIEFYDRRAASPCCRYIDHPRRAANAERRFGCGNLHVAVLSNQAGDKSGRAAGDVEQGSIALGALLVDEPVNNDARIRRKAERCFIIERDAERRVRLGLQGILLEDLILDLQGRSGVTAARDCGVAAQRRNRAYRIVGGRRRRRRRIWRVLIRRWSRRDLRKSTRLNS